MGESLVTAQKLENKMSEPVTHVTCLQESVSFGRFEHDSLCWERWSTFPTNKYLEEVGKCSTPGSVAQKKVYFEEHYKKIAARKAELMDQEMKQETELENLEDHGPTLMGSVCDSSEEEWEVDKCNAQNPAHGTEVENKVVDFIEVVSDNDGVSIIDDENKVSDFISNGTEVRVVSEGDKVANFTIETSELVDEPNIGSDNIKKNKSSEPQLEDATNDLYSNKESPKLKPEEPEFVKEEAASTLVSQDKEELPLDKVEEREMVVKETKDLLKLKTPKTMRKATSMKKTTNSTGAKKKPASPMPKGSAATPISKRSAATMPKSPILSTHRSSKRVNSQTVMSKTSPSVKRDSVTGKKAARPENKRVFSTSLHMSLSLEPANSDPASQATRKPLIMESMGDKDIVKRAFKTFQKCNKLSPSSLTRSPATNQSISKKNEQKGSGLDINQKKNEGILRPVKAANPHAGQLRMAKTSISPGSRKTIGADQRNGRSIPSLFGSRILDQGNKQGVSKKLEQKSKSKEAGKIFLQSKATLEKAADIRRPSQSINSKTNLSSSRNQGRLSKEAA